MPTADGTTPRTPTTSRQQTLAPVGSKRHSGGLEASTCSASDTQVNGIGALTDTTGHAARCVLLPKSVRTFVGLNRRCGTSAGWAVGPWIRGAFTTNADGDG